MNVNDINHTMYIQHIASAHSKTQLMLVFVMYFVGHVLGAGELREENLASQGLSSVWGGVGE